MIKLGRMRIENFKSFIDPVEFDFTGNDLVLFDGPNGFGKTTVFDAVELCFTGEISRVKHTDSKTKKDHILKGRNTKPTNIHLELLEGAETLLVICIHIPANISGEAGKVSKYKHAIERFEVNAWQDEAVTPKLINKKLDEDGLKRLLRNRKLDTTFTLFNYIQQEETCHFLKLDEIKRHQHVSHLFGTIEETQKSQKLDLLSAKLKEKIDTYTHLIEKEGAELAELSKPSIQESDDETHAGSGKLPIFSDLSTNTVEQLEAYKNNLEGVDWILKNHSDFESLKFNYLLHKITTERITQLDNYLKVGVVANYEEIKKLDKHYLVWRKASKKAGIYTELIKLFDEEPNTLTKDILNKYNEAFATRYSEFTRDITTFDNLSKVSGSLSSLLIKIDENRENLLSHFKEHLNHDALQEHQTIPCPFCGDLKSEWQVLLDEYDAQTKLFSGQLGDNGKLLAAVTKRLVNDLVAPLVVKMRRYNQKYDKYLNFDLNSLKENKKIEETDFESMVKTKNWLALNIEGCSGFADNSLLEVNQNYSEAREQLITYINSHKKTILEEVPKAYLSFVQDLKALDVAFDDNNHLAIDSSDISKDLLLLSKLLVQQNSTLYKAKEVNLASLKAKVYKLQNKRNEISNISTVFKKEIKAYEKDVAKHIAIPLFVYSSKILQSRPEGSGIFLITPETDNAKGFMQFSATPNDSHDAWNTMSSGQLAGVVISFMLAMNKVYPSNLKTLMIDDPVQTMDEVNMASFVQLMRYEFPDMQILLSTHESKVANYFHYKYGEAGLTSLPINMKNKRLHLVE
ncbi:AAA family ATPase [Paraglaciecola aquimarina]|uniref:AAA family ATPase n=1 Tax=Paraglaciecola algarum TaxID=3050085 RepID=A0ABS9D6G3_9ALTE|nr:AAA family ATPase [Paraglaciecola sp. G1-23]